MLVFFHGVGHFLVDNPIGLAVKQMICFRYKNWRWLNNEATRKN
jgi:hypothetical protein